MNKVKTLAGQTVVYGLGSILPRVLNFLILTTFYTSIFDLKPYGILSEMYAYLALALVVIEFGMESGFFRFAKDRNMLGKSFSHAIGFIGIMAALWMICIYLFINKIASAIHYQNNPQYIIWMAWIVAIDSIVLIPFAKIRQDGKAVRFALLKIANVLINIVLVMIVLVVFPWMAKRNVNLPGWLYDPNLGVGYVFLCNMIASALMFLLLIPELRSFKWEYDRKFMGSLLKYAAPLVLVGLAGSINDSGDKIFVGMITHDQAQTGIYAANYRIAVLMTLFVQMFRYAFEPFLFKESREKDSGNTYALVMKYFIMAGLAIFLVTALYIDIFKYLIDKKYWEGLNVVPIVLMGNLFLGIYYNLSVWYKLRDKTRYAAIMACLGALVTVVMNWILVPKIGYIGAAWATLACYGAMMILSYLWGRKIYPLPYETGNLLIWIALSIVLYGLSRIMKPELIWIRFAWNGLLLCVFVAAVGYKEGWTLRKIGQFIKRN